ncbi:hypothetical protein CKM354_000866300 [Cercospora kikuchii]|uniref:Uncharacterized protein n=1 Tax=Cercospora kikuchii TaxID=84275 RepID=A0A9P3CRV8_9PEZI|nr:uncharacterized protein CKM354_000866300 [Cercospora kikuchii]GIZ45500.1 hypothetical protein CKM354_000866300 [Cercospora kikuchii]
MLSRWLVVLLASSLCHASPVSFSEFLAQDSNSGRTPEIPRLKPTVRWDRQLDDWNDLIPQTAQQLYFGSPDPLEKHQFARLNGQFHWESSCS